MFVIIRWRPNFLKKKSMVFSKKKKSSHGISLIFLNFGPQIKVFSRKKSSPKFVHYFLQLIIVAALKFLTLPKFFSLPGKFWFCSNIFLSLPKKFKFCPNFRNLGAIALPVLQPGTAMLMLKRGFCISFTEKNCLC